MFIDTHTHIYLDEFDNDRESALKRAIDNGVGKMLLPNIDIDSWKPMLNLCHQHPQHCFAMAGLHPTSVLPETYRRQMDEVERQLAQNKFVAMGEIGIDLYWDRTHQDLQEEAFKYQLQLAKKYKLPVAIHVRNSYNEVWRILKSELNSELTGVFHCFPGNEIQARQVLDAGFYLGIGGVITYKKSDMQEVVKVFKTRNIVLETDAPFLPPVPYRGKRNEPSYIPLIAQKVAEYAGITLAEVEEQTTLNAQNLFNL